MKPSSFEYVAPATLEEALEALAGRAGEAKVLAGGQSLVPAMNFRLATPEVLIDLNRVGAHDRVRVQDGALVVEMLVRHRMLEHLELGGDALAGLLGRTARLVGHLPIRVRGTFAGSLAHADPAAEWCMLALALDAEIVAHSATAQRRIAAADLFQGLLTTALEEDEIITEVRIPLLGRAGTAVHEKAQTAGDFATVAVTAILRLEGGVVAETRLGIGGVEARPVRPRRAEAVVTGAPPDADALDAAARAAAEEVDPISDATCSGDYRRHLVEVLVRRSLADAAGAAA
jgi:carbon-monoxide dehydrogenase medium subunit